MKLEKEHCRRDQRQELGLFLKPLGYHATILTSTLDGLSSLKAVSVS